MKLQYQLGGTENGTGSMHQAYCDTELPVTPKPTVETTINLEGEAGEAQPAEIRSINILCRLLRKNESNRSILCRHIKTFIKVQNSLLKVFQLNA